MRDGDELVCRIQTDLGAETAYLLCAPVVLRRDWTIPTPMLHVPLDLDGEPRLVLMTQMVALPSASLGPVVGTAASVRDEIVRAVDLLVIGF
jgi:toxin CcdB